MHDCLGQQLFPFPTALVLLIGLSVTLSPSHSPEGAGHLRLLHSVVIINLSLTPPRGHLLLEGRGGGVVPVLNSLMMGCYTPHHVTFASAYVFLYVSPNAGNSGFIRVGGSSGPLG